ncbi:hypothetical protein [Burkholderia sp. F1]|uniref:hypothetical protein n=1 Tax=Burkholderia sp. F1 TaxID=3366817 RepID=UPI003D706419
MQRTNFPPLTGYCDARVLLMHGGDVTDVFDEATIRATQARDLAAAIETAVETGSSGDAAVFRSAMSAITTLLSDAIGLYGYAHDMQNGTPGRK